MVTALVFSKIHDKYLNERAYEIYRKMKSVDIEAKISVLNFTHHAVPLVKLKDMRLPKLYDIQGASKVLGLMLKINLK